MDSASSRKRKADSGEGSGAKRSKGGKKKWIVPRKGEDGSGDARHRALHEPEAGDSGIWVTCDMQKEAKCISELKPLFEEHAARIYDLDEVVAEKQPGDIAREIAKELDEIRDQERKLFRNVRLDTQCLIFLKTAPPIEPVEFVVSYCKRAQSQPDRKETRSVRKLTPITLVGKATEKGIDEVAKKVLAPHFYGDGVLAKKFAIRANLRNHTTMKRIDIIKQVAEAVGTAHRVDLENYDILILVEIYQNSCGMSVVGNDYDKLKRFNLAEIYAPTPSNPVPIQ